MSNLIQVNNGSTSFKPTLEDNFVVHSKLNAYQKDFDTEKNRDSNYVYGPARPRSFYAGIKIKI